VVGVVVVVVGVEDERKHNFSPFRLKKFMVNYTMQQAVSFWIIIIIIIIMIFTLFSSY